MPLLGLSIFSPPQLLVPRPLLLFIVLYLLLVLIHDNDRSYSYNRLLGLSYGIICLRDFVSQLVSIQTTATTSLPVLALLLNFIASYK
jgi:hypothetical protein